MMLTDNSSIPLSVSFIWTENRFQSVSLNNYFFEKLDVKISKVEKLPNNEIVSWFFPV